jgi:hypothetical protein
MHVWVRDITRRFVVKDHQLVDVVGCTRGLLGRHACACNQFLSIPSSVLCADKRATHRSGLASGWPHTNPWVCFQPMGGASAWAGKRDLQLCVVQHARVCVGGLIGTASRRRPYAVTAMMLTAAGICVLQC